jgi:hypothetical protein
MSERKISETLLDFAQPILECVPENLPPQRLEEYLRLPITIWNAVIVDELGTMPGAVTQARALVARISNPLQIAVFDSMVERKRTCFGSDHRLIGRHWVRVDPDGTLHIRAEALLPRSPAT